MSDLPTFKDLFKVARDEILARNSQVTRDAIDRDGSDANALTASSAAVGDEVIGQVARVQGTLFLDSCHGTDLDRTIIDRYNLFRKAAAPGFTSLVWVLPSVNPLAFNIPAGTRVQTQDGRQWVTLTNIVFSAGALSATTAARSASAGLSQQASALTITNIIDTPSGSPNTLKVSNPLASAGADDAESDDDYRNRARQFFATARRGTLSAIQNAALGIPGVRRASVFETIDGDGRAARVVQLVVADGFTDSLVGTVVPVAYQTQSQLLATQVETGLDEARAGGIFVSATVAQVVLQPVQLGLSFMAGANVDQSAFQARAVVVSYMNSLAPGQTFSRADAATVLQSVPGLVVSGNEVVSPIGNVVPRTLQVLRTSLSLVAAVSVQPDTALQGSTNPDGVA